MLLILNLPSVKREKNWTFWLFWLEGIVLAGEDVRSEYKPRLVSKSEINFLEDDITLFPFFLKNLKFGVGEFDPMPSLWKGFICQ